MNHTVMGKKVLVVGGGGRCHAIVDALSRSPKVSKIYCAPGNAGIAAQAECVPLKDTQIEELKKFAVDNSVDLTVVGPEASLAAGIADVFYAAGLRIFGPSKAAATIESSKDFAKRLMSKYDVPTAAYETFEDYGKDKGDPILILHGYLCSSKFFYKNIEALSADHRLVLMDWRGHGSSSKCLHNLTMDRCAKDVHELIEHLGLEDVTLLGWSMGSSVVMEYYEQFGDEHLKKIGVIDAAAFTSLDTEAIIAQINQELGA